MTYSNGSRRKEQGKSRTADQGGEFKFGGVKNR